MKLEMQFLELTILGNSLTHWLSAVGVLLLGFFLPRLVTRIVGRRLTELAPQTKTQLDDVVARMIGKTKSLFLFIVGLFLGSLLLQLPERVHQIVESLFIIALLIQAGIWIVVGANTMLEQYRQRA